MPIAAFNSSGYATMRESINYGLAKGLLFGSLIGAIIGAIFGTLGAGVKKYQLTRLAS